jgi:aryl-alcohol dehydrogenase-like predicted oxidoreductase
VYGDDIVPIPGTKQRKYLEEDIDAAKITLTSKDIKELDDAIPEGVVAGPRYSQQNMTFIDR